MAPKRKIASQFDDDINQEVQDTEIAFSNAVCDFYEQVREKLPACQEPRKTLIYGEGDIDERQLALDIAETDRAAYNTIQSLLDEVSKSEKSISEVWIECYAKNRRGANTTKATFEFFNESLGYFRKDINETISYVKMEIEAFNPMFLYKAASEEAVKIYHQKQMALIARETNAKQNGPRM